MRLYLKLSLSVFFCLLSVGAFCQGFTDDVNDIPFDGGISLLVAAGISYGVKKTYQQRKKKNQPVE
jgi:hypothetical protein